MSHVQVAFISKSIIQRLKIERCSQCDKISDEFFCTSNIEFRRLSRHNMGGCKGKCYMKKCDGHIQAKFLADNECEIIGTRHSPRMIETKLKNDKLFIPHVMAVEKRRCRTDSGT